MANLVKIINLEDGPRDYPLKHGERSIYLEPKGKRSIPICVAPDEISEALLKAEKKGLIRIEKMSFVPAEETAKEAVE